MCQSMNLRIFHQNDDDLELFVEGVHIMLKYMALRIFECIYSATSDFRQQVLFFEKKKTNVSMSSDVGEASCDDFPWQITK